MTARSFSYSGRDNLDAMRSAIRYNAFLVELVSRFARPGDRVLDFGAGLGQFAGEMRNKGFDVICLEVDESMASRLVEQDFITVQSPDLLSDESLDYLYSLNVLEHIDNDAAAIRALVPKLRRGGRCLFYVPAFPALFTEMDRLVGHHRRYTASSLFGVLEKSGLVVEQVEYVDSLGFPATLAYRLMGGNGALHSSAVALYDRWVFPFSRAIDIVSRRWFGKNVFAVATRR